MLPEPGSRRRAPRDRGWQTSPIRPLRQSIVRATIAPVQRDPVWLPRRSDLPSGFRRFSERPRSDSLPQFDSAALLPHRRVSTLAQGPAACGEKASATPSGRQRWDYPRAARRCPAAGFPHFAGAGAMRAPARDSTPEPDRPFEPPRAAPPSHQACPRAGPYEAVARRLSGNRFWPDRAVPRGLSPADSIARFPPHARPVQPIDPCDRIAALWSEQVRSTAFSGRESEVQVPPRTSADRRPAPTA